jgi:hypothetical protein
LSTSHTVSYIFIMDELFREQAQELMTLKANGAFKGNLAAFKLQMKAISDEATKRAEQRLLERTRIEDEELKTPEQTTLEKTATRSSPRIQAGQAMKQQSTAPVIPVLPLPRPPFCCSLSSRPARPSAASRAPCLTVFLLVDRAEGAP